MALVFSYSGLAQRMNVSSPVYMQNSFYQEFTKADSAQKIIINGNTTASCDTLTGVLKQFYTNEIKLDTAIDRLEVSSIFRFDYEDGQLALITYEMLGDTLVLSKSSVTLFKSSNCWEKRNIAELSNIITAFLYIKPDSFWAFYNQGESEIVEINSIRKRFKTTDGILDIDKLGAYLKTKPKELEKYCDY